MNHLERMRALRTQVDLIIGHTEAMTELNAHDSDTIGLSTFVSQPGRPYRELYLAVPTVELRALVERRIAEAEAEIRKLGMVAPAPAGSDVLERVRQQPGVGPMYPDLRTPACAARRPADLANPGS